MAMVGLWREVLLVPYNGRIEVYDNRSSHERDLLHYGYIQGRHLTCLSHHATFDVRT
jgi:nitrite reductase/ring-hydroxylating ferredoxin subunit